ncbi:MAG TPA: hypothetical protein VKR31_10065 [Rhizomicrobium sp.]|nr:hypothetical protein [Rhizomicrobium sp.]
MRSCTIALLAGASLFAAFPAIAQSGAGQLPLTSAAGYPPQEVLPSPFRCADFTRNSDGSWSPLRPVTIKSGDTKATLQPGESLNAGATFGGVDVAADLNRRCIAH